MLGATVGLAEVGVVDFAAVESVVQRFCWVAGDKGLSSAYLCSQGADDSLTLRPLT